MRAHRYGRLIPTRNEPVEGPRRRGRLALAVALTTGVLVATPWATTPALAAGGGTVWTVGLGSDGQLGQGSTANRTAFGNVASISDVAQVAGGREHVVALGTSGQVWSWGDNSKGAVGDGTSADRTTPTAVLAGAIGVAAGHYHSMAILPGGSVRSWGFNNYGQLGDGTTVNRNTPVVVSGLTGVEEAFGGRDMSYALLGSGQVRAWGNNPNGELGDGSTTQRTTPVAVSGITNAVALAAGRNHGLALLSDGTVRAWGLNKYGQLGDGTTSNRTTPVSVSGITNAIAIGAGAEHSMAVLADGTVRSWGRGYRGQLGSGSTSNRLTPGPIAGLSAVASVEAGRDHSLAITTDGRLYAWGFDDYGQLGDGGTSNRRTPYLVPGITDAVEAAGGRAYTVLLRGSAPVPDTVAPTTPGTPAATSTASGRVDLSWAASSDDRASSLTYQVYRDGGSTAVGSVVSASTGLVAWSETGRAPGATHTYRVSASDGTNTSPLSAQSSAVTVAGSGGGGGDVVVQSDFSDLPGAFTASVGLTADGTRFAPGDSPPSARATPSNGAAYALRSFGSSESGVCASVSVRVESIGPKAVSMLKLRSASRVVAQLMIAPTGKLKVRAAIAKRTYTPGPVIIDNTWTKVALCATVGSGGSLQAGVDGRTVASWTTDNGTAALTRIQVGDNLKKTATYNLDTLLVTR